MHFADEVVEHLLGDAIVGDNAVFQRADGLDVSGGAPEHFLGAQPDRADALLRADGFNRHHRGLVEHDALSVQVDDGVGGAKVYRHVFGEKTAENAEHDKR